MTKNYESGRNDARAARYERDDSHNIGSYVRSKLAGVALLAAVALPGMGAVSYNQGPSFIETVRSSYDFSGIDIKETAANGAGLAGLAIAMSSLISASSRSRRNPEASDAYRFSKM